MLLNDLRYPEFRRYAPRRDKNAQQYLIKVQLLGSKFLLLPSKK